MPQIDSGCPNPALAISCCPCHLPHPQPPPPLAIPPQSGSQWETPTSDAGLPFGFLSNQATWFPKTTHPCGPIFWARIPPDPRHWHHEEGDLRGGAHGHPDGEVQLPSVGGGHRGGVLRRIAHDGQQNHPDEGLKSLTRTMY